MRRALLDGRADNMVAVDMKRERERPSQWEQEKERRKKELKVSRESMSNSDRMRELRETNLY